MINKERVLSKKVFFHALFCCLIIFSLSTLWSQEKKLFPIYLEISAPVLLNENGFFESYDTNTTYFRKGKSNGTTEANELTFQTYSIGWQFARDKGKIVLAYINYEEGSSDTLVNHLGYDIDSESNIIDDYFDPNLDFEFFDGPPVYLIKALDANLGMETTLYDIAFWKNFGKGKRFSGVWNAGFRVANHDQKVPIGYFISFNNPVSWIGDNFASEVFLINEECRSYGPKGGGIVNFYLFNKRLILSAGADISLTFGETRVPRQVIPIAVDYEYDADWNVILLYPEDVGLEPYTIAEEKDKSYWFSIVDFSVKFKIFKEFYAFVGYRFSDFRNVFLAPSFVNPPSPTDTPPYGIYFSYTFEDISYRTPYFGFSIQF